jgi:hypothetical protein
MTANLPAPLAADAGLVINDRSLAVSNGRVFVRVPENAAAPETTIRLSQDANGNGGNNSSFVNLFNGVTGKVSSADGRYLVFESTATNLLEPATTTLGTRAVFRYDRDANGDGVFDETAPGGTALELVSVQDDETRCQLAEGSFRATAASSPSPYDPVSPACRCVAAPFSLPRPAARSCCATLSPAPPRSSAWDPATSTTATTRPPASRRRPLRRLPEPSTNLELVDTNTYGPQTRRWIPIPARAATSTSATAAA